MGSLQGAGLGEGVHGSMKPRGLVKGLGVGDKRQHQEALVLPSLLHPDLLNSVSAQRFFLTWEVIPFCSVSISFPSTLTASLIQLFQRNSEKLREQVI